MPTSFLMMVISWPKRWNIIFFWWKAVIWVWASVAHNPFFTAIACLCCDFKIQQYQLMIPFAFFSFSSPVQFSILFLKVFWLWFADLMLTEPSMPSHHCSISVQSVLSSCYACPNLSTSGFHYYFISWVWDRSNFLERKALCAIQHRRYFESKFTLRQKHRQLSRLLPK